MLCRISRFCGFPPGYEPLKRLNLWVIVKSLLAFAKIGVSISRCGRPDRFGEPDMHVRKWGLVVLALVGGAMTASVASADPPEKHGKLYHKNVCGHGNPHDTARCHAKVLTDAAGDEVDGMDVAANAEALGAANVEAAALTPNAVPAGYGPSDLRSAYNITTDGTTTIAIVDAYGYPNA